MEVQARQQSHGTVVPAPEEAALPYFFSWAILNLTHPIKQPSNTTAATRRKKEAVSTLICLMWGVNHCFSHSRERLHRDRHFYTLSTVVLRQKKTLVTGNRTTEMTGNKGITRKCSRTRLVWSRRERGKPQPKKDSEEGGGSHVRSLAKTPHPSYKSISY